MNKTDLSAAMIALMTQASRSGSFKKQDVDKVLDDRLTRGKTRKGAKHKVGKTFKSINRMEGLTPAKYRHLHLGTKRGVTANGYPRYY